MADKNGKGNCTDPDPSLLRMTMLFGLVVEKQIPCGMTNKNGKGIAKDPDPSLC